MRRGNSHDRGLINWVIASSLYGATMVSIALLSPPEISATTIIAFVRADHIVMATDAMSIVFNNVEVQRVKICKIYQSGSSFFAFAGIDQDDSIGFVSSD